MTRFARRRAGFTLIELITVIAIMLTLAAMIIAVAYTGANKQLTGNGASAIVGWCKTAQAYALRDQKPYGLRLHPDPTTGLVTNAIFIEQPEPWIGPVGSTILCDPVLPPIGFTVKADAPTDFTGGQGANATLYPIQGRSTTPPGDFLELPNGQIAIVEKVTGPTTMECSFMPPDTQPMWKFAGQSGWRFIRQPRAMIGADALNLAPGVAINTLPNSNGALPQSPLPNLGGNIDIVFGPTGAVITPGLSGRDIRLWVVDTTQQGFSPGAASFQGEPLIVTIGVRTGLIGIQSVTPGANPYLFSQDGKTSGY